MVGDLINGDERPEDTDGDEQFKLSSGHEFTHNPISSSSEDRLGRAAFARVLGRALVEYPETGSLVVALYGDWGSGKTSTLNMAFETIEQAGYEPAPLVVRFNPWWYSNTGELLMRFFEQLGEEIGREVDDGNQEAGRGIKDKFSRYGRLLTPLGGLVDLAGGWSRNGDREDTGAGFTSGSQRCR